VRANGVKPYNNNHALLNFLQLLYILLYLMWIPPTYVYSAKIFCLITLQIVCFLVAPLARSSASTTVTDLLKRQLSNKLKGFSMAISSQQSIPDLFVYNILYALYLFTEAWITSLRSVTKDIPVQRVVVVLLLYLFITAILPPKVFWIVVYVYYI